MRPAGHLIREAFANGLRLGTVSSLRAALRVAVEARTLDEVREVQRRLLEQHEAEFTTRREPEPPG